MYVIVFLEPENLPLEGRIRLESNVTTLRGKFVVFTINSDSQNSIYITDIAGDCSIIPPPIALKPRASFDLDGECRLDLVRGDGTVDLVFTYKVKGQDGTEKQAIKIYLENETES
ncbi:MAG: hypothetical protein ABH834_03765 [Candidatus Altiarchaeota archaeon]